MSVAFGRWSAPAVQHVILAMRPADRREVFALRRSDDPFELFADLVAMRERALWFEVVYDRDLMGDPLAFFGVFHLTPQVGSAAMIATAGLKPRGAAEIARRVRRVVIPDLLRLGVQRVQCERWESHGQAASFLRACGALEAAEPRYCVGKRGEDFREHYWLARDWRRPA